MDLPKRKRNRLPNYDYSTPGAYFITICTDGKQCILGRIVGGGALDAPLVQLSKCGSIVQKHIQSGNNIPGITVDKYVIMPNHIHLILLIDPAASGAATRAASPANAVVPHFVSTLKRFVHRDLGSKIFQRSYHDHVIRDEKDYLKIWRYIDDNPAKWNEDCFYADPRTSAMEEPL